MYKVLLFSACGLFLFSAVACHDHDDHDGDDKTAPVLTISEPTAGESLSGEIHIHGTVTDETSLHELSIKITRDSDNSEMFSAAPSVHDLTAYDFDEHWTPTGLTAETDVTLTIVVADHGDNNDTKTVKFKVKP